MGQGGGPIGAACGIAAVAPVTSPVMTPGCNETFFYNNSSRIIVLLFPRGGHDSARGRGPPARDAHEPAERELGTQGQGHALPARSTSMRHGGSEL